MSESRALHQILVLDNDEDFISLLQSELGSYGFEIQAVKPDSNKIHALDLYKAELILIAVEAPDVTGYTLYDQARKKVGRSIPIALTTATLTAEDFALHKQLKEPADAYLHKRSLSPNEVPPEIYELIGLKLRKGYLHQKNGHSYAQSKNIETISVSKNELDRSEELNAKKPTILEVADSRYNEKQAISSQADISQDQKNKQELKIMNELKQALSDLEREASHLYNQTNKESQDIRPSQLLNHVLNQKNQNGHKNGEINNFLKKIQEDNKRVLAGKDKLKKFMKDMNDFEKEIDQDLKRNKEIAALLEIKQKMIDEATMSAEMLTKERLAHQETRKQLEFKIAHLKAELIGKEKQYLFQLNAAEEKSKTDNLKAKEEQQRALRELHENYTAEISKLRTEKNDEINTLKEKVSTEMEKITEMLTEKEKSYQESCKKYESEIAKLQTELEEAKKQQISQINATEEKHKTELLHAEKVHSSIVDSIVKKFAEQMAQIRIELDNERQTHKNVREDLETKITQLSDQKDSAQERMNPDHKKTLDEQKDTDLLTDDK
jgi:DNA-binding response OmpR family regulator